MVPIGEYYFKKSWKTSAQVELPYLPTPMSAVKAIFSFLFDNEMIEERQSLVDLGAGDGRIIIYGARQYHMQSLGLEINTEMVDSINNKINAGNLQSLCRVEEIDLHHYDISSFDLIFTYFIPNAHKTCSHIFDKVKRGVIVVGIKWNLDSYKNLWLEKHTLKVDGQEYFIYIKK